MNNSLEQMVQQYSHLFFYYEKCKQYGDVEKLNKVVEQKKAIINRLKEKGYDVGTLIEKLKMKKTFQKEYETVILFSDGGVRNNHDLSKESLAASAFAIYGDQQMIHHQATWIGNNITLPNQKNVDINSTLAEYHGFDYGLKFVEEFKVKAKKVIFLTDCSTMVQHLQKKLPSHPSLREYAQDIRIRLKNFSNATVKYIPREHNKIVDKLVNQLMDEYERRDVYAEN